MNIPVIDNIENKINEINTIIPKAIEKIEGNLNEYFIKSFKEISKLNEEIESIRNKINELESDKVIFFMHMIENNNELLKEINNTITNLSSFGKWINKIKTMIYSWFERNRLK